MLKIYIKTYKYKPSSLVTDTEVSIELDHIHLSRIVICYFCHMNPSENIQDGRQNKLNCNQAVWDSCVTGYPQVCAIAIATRVNQDGETSWSWVSMCFLLLVTT